MRGQDYVGVERMFEIEICRSEVMRCADVSLNAA